MSASLKIFWTNYHVILSYIDASNTWCLKYKNLAHLAQPLSYHLENFKYRFPSIIYIQNQPRVIFSDPGAPLRFFFIKIQFYMTVLEWHCMFDVQRSSVLEGC